MRGMREKADGRRRLRKWGGGGGGGRGVMEGEMGNREIKELVSETVMVREKADGRRSLRGRGWG